MRRDSIQRRLVATVILSQAILTVGLMVTGVVATYWRLLATLDAGMQAQAVSVAVLVRYTDDPPETSTSTTACCPNRSIQIILTNSKSGLTAPACWHAPKTGPKGCPWNLAPTSIGISPGQGVPYHALRITHVPILDREEDKGYRPQTLTIVYASPTIRIRQQVKAAAAFIALVSLVLLGATAWLASWGIRRGLFPLQALAQQAAQVSTQSWRLVVRKKPKRLKSCVL